MGVWSVLAVLALAGIGAWTARTLVLQGRLLPSLRPFVAVFAKPSDYFSPLQKSSLDLSREGLRTTMKLQHRYAGRHTVDISVSKSVPNGVISYEANFELLLEFLVDGRAIVSRNLQGVSPWWSHSENGFTLATYTVPDDAPVAEEIELAVTVKKADPDFERRYGAVALFARKASEK